MSTSASKAFIQARMNSSRYPGKSLAPLADRPVIDRVISRVTKVISENDIVVLTTEDHPEDPLVSYLCDREISIFRGHPTNVFLRFQEALEAYPCDSLFRVCGDSPFLEPTLFKKAIGLFEDGEYDIVSNVFTRDFPSGKSVELLDAATFKSIDNSELTAAQQEHVTKYFYDNSHDYNIRDIPCPVETYNQQTYAVDTLEDLKMLEEKLNSGTLSEAQFRVS